MPPSVASALPVKGGYLTVMWFKHRTQTSDLNFPWELSFFVRRTGRTAPLPLDRAHTFPPDSGNVRWLRNEPAACAVRIGRPWSSARAAPGCTCSSFRPGQRNGAVLPGSRHMTKLVSIPPPPKRSALINESNTPWNAPFHLQTSKKGGSALLAADSLKWVPVKYSTVTNWLVYTAHRRVI